MHLRVTTDFGIRLPAAYTRHEEGETDTHRLESPTTPAGQRTYAAKIVGARSGTENHYLPLGGWRAGQVGGMR